MSTQPVISVITPTFNRGGLLSRVHESLATGTVPPLEWIVVDDGSTDNTRHVVNHLTHEGAFPIRYVHKSNGGENSAMNIGFSMAEGELVCKVDSDDWLLPHGLETLQLHWESIPAELKEAHAGVAGLCIDPEGKRIGDGFPASPFSDDYVRVRINGKVHGDKCEAIRRELVGESTYPVSDDARIPGSGYLLANLGRRGYVFRFFNEAVKVKEYRSDGLNAIPHRLRSQSDSRGYALFLRELLLHPELKLTRRLSMWRNLIARGDIRYVAPDIIRHPKGKWLKN